MKILIAYSSKNGTVKECVRRLAQELQPMAVELADLDAEAPSVQDYDAVLVGGSVYFGRFRPSLRRFLKANGAILQGKCTGLFLCCGLTHEADYYLEKLFPKELRESSVATVYFGGRLKADEGSRWDRWILRSMRARLLEEEMENEDYSPTLPGILPETIASMASRIRTELLHKTVQ
ncbi:MAG: flavodoxin domain-containing protein [Clostridia bacterium]|nr:flavodoxin domain-containing protein [Clostridia bacterium]